MTYRHVTDTWKTQPTLEGAGVRLERAFSHDGVKALDPFLLLDHFHSPHREDYEKGFPWHPHRGMETITYILEGEVEHGDSMGNRGRIGPGDVQWMTAGSGIIHQEMPVGDASGRMAGFQLWANLPARDKMMHPRYQEVKQADIPQVTSAEGVRVRVICGAAGGVRGPVAGVVTDPEYLDVTMPPHTTWTHAVHAGYTAFAYVFSGPGRFGDPARPVVPGTVVLFERDGDGIRVASDDAELRFLLVSGKPLNEPVAWAGPIVMNTQEELRHAFAELKEGTFVKHSVTA